VALFFEHKIKLLMSLDRFVFGWYFQAWVLSLSHKKKAEVLDG